MATRLMMVPMAMGNYRRRQLPAAVQPARPPGPPNLRLWAAHVDAGINTAYYNKVLVEELARLAGKIRAELSVEAERAWVEDLYDRAGLTPQERRAIDRAAEGWSSKEIAHDMTPVKHLNRGWTLSLETIERYLRRAKRKLRNEIFVRPVNSSTSDFYAFRRVSSPLRGGNGPQRDP